MRVGETMGRRKEGRRGRERPPIRLSGYGTGQKLLEAAISTLKTRCSRCLLEMTTLTVIAQL